MRIEVAEKFSKDCRKLGIGIHGTFVMGLPGETRDSIRETIKFAKKVNPHTLQVSLAAPYPGTHLYAQALAHGWLDSDNAELVDENGVQIAPLPIPTSATRKFSTRSRRFIANSISARARSARSSGKWRATRTC